MARVLVVEDDAGARQMLCESISALGHEPEAARDGLEALERFRSGTYDVVVTDMVMPRMDGIELTRRLKSVDPDVAVVMVTGQTSLDLMVRALNRGITDYLNKPVPLDSLERSVERVLDGKASLPPRKPAGARSGGRALAWLLALLAVGLLATVGWWAWKQDAGLHELSRSMGIADIGHR